MVSYRKKLVFGILTLLMVGLTACSQKQPVDLGPDVTAPAISVTIDNDICPFIEVQSGWQVTWLNGDKREHTIQFLKSDVQTLEVSSGNLKPGDRFAFTFVEPGEFVYRCSTDNEMTGKVTVLP